MMISMFTSISKQFKIFNSIIPLILKTTHRIFVSFLKTLQSFWHKYLQLKRVVARLLTKARLSVFTSLTTQYRHKKSAPMLAIFIILLLISLSSISCASLKVTYDGEGRVKEVWSTSVQDTEVVQEKDGVKTIIKRKAAWTLWPSNPLFSIYKD